MRWERGLLHRKAFTKRFVRDVSKSRKSRASIRGMDNRTIPRFFVYRVSKTGVSVRYIETPDKSWYVFRASYGREDKASDYLVDDGTYTYIAKKIVERYIRGKRKRYLQTLIPNLLFAYTTEAKAEEYVNNTPDLSYLTYYYNHFELDDEKKNPPLTVSCNEMGKFVKATCNKNKHLLLVHIVLIGMIKLQISKNW